MFTPQKSIYSPQAVSTVMELKDVNPNTGNVDVVVDVVSKDEPRTFEKFG